MLHGQILELFVFVFENQISVLTYFKSTFLITREIINIFTCVCREIYELPKGLEYCSTTCEIAYIYVCFNDYIYLNS